MHRTQTPGAGADNTGQLVLIESHEAEASAVLSPHQRRDRILLAVFAAVMVITAAYNYLIATPRYASQFSYVVRSATPARDRISFMNFSANGESSDNAEAIIAYVASRDLIGTINRDGLVSRMFEGPTLDLFSGFPSLLAGSGREHLFRHFQHYLDASYDEKTDISYIEVQAFTAETAQTLAERIRVASEDMVNRLNTRARAGMTQAAEREVAAARANLAGILGQINTVQTRNGVLDPELQSRAAVKVASHFAEELATIDIEIAQTKRAAPNNPAIAQMRSRREAIRRELNRQSTAMAGGPNSLADRIRVSEELTVAQEAAEKRLLGASLALANARSNADRNRLYLEWISQPNRPDEPLYPRRGRNMLLAAVLSIAVLWIVRSLSELLYDSDE